QYCVEFYVSIANICLYTTDRIGAYFSNDSVLQVMANTILVTPQIENIIGNFIIDSLGWTKISGNFIASGGEKFMVLGNFRDWTVVDTMLLNYSFASYAYFYIDDVSVYPCDAPVFTAEAGSNQNICLGDSVQIGDTSRSEYIYWWTPIAGLSNDSIANPMASPAVTTTYYLHQKDFKFDETIDSVTVFVYPALPDNAAGNDTLICEGGQAQLGITAGTFSYHWQFSSDLSDTAIANPTAMPLNTSTYILTISNTGCTKTDSVTVAVENCDTAQNSLTIVNAFTPNGDGKNDLFKAKGTNIKTVHLKIINRWGQLLFEATSNDPGWDGTYKGQEVNPGVYYYVIEVTFEDGEVRNKAGSVHLIR
ncbi:MAG: gliding motility-associated C-terminal domain-containing protein, partial [Bacteroidota bacterium]